MNRRPKICAVITSDDLDAVRQVEPLVDLFEVRIDLIGDSWQKLARQLELPWIACNRCAEEGGSWPGSESERREELFGAIELGADIIDIELMTGNLEKIIQLIRKRAKCLLSFHDLNGTPPLDRLREILKRQSEAGADICKLVTTALTLEDNMAVLQLISEFPEAGVVSFAMGPLGIASRILSPLAGGYFTYASIGEGKESASGQITVKDLRKIYGMLKDER